MLQTGGRHNMSPPLYVVAQLQPIHALRLACGAQLPVAVGAMNMHPNS